jgi:hypothetical protein
MSDMEKTKEMAKKTDSPSISSGNGNAYRLVASEGTLSKLQL